MTRPTNYAMNNNGVYTRLACGSPENAYHKNTCVYYRNPIEEGRNVCTNPSFARGGVVSKSATEQVMGAIQASHGTQYISAKDVERATTSDPVNHPAHYNNGPPCPGCGRIIECIDVIEARPCLRANAIKYLWRADDKDKTIEDLKKATWYIQREINNLEQTKP